MPQLEHRHGATGTPCPWRTDPRPRLLRCCRMAVERPRRFRSTLAEDDLLRWAETAGNDGPMGGRRCYDALPVLPTALQEGSG